jgi:Flp pilus assembly protein TadG
MKRLFCDNEGAALVELAVAAPVFLLIMLGAYELGRIAHYAIEVQNAARAAASYGAVNVGNAGTTSSVTQAAKNDAPDLPGLTATPTYACVCETLNTTTNTPSFSPSSGTVSCTDTTITSCTAESSTSIQSVVPYITVSTQATVNSLFKVRGLGLPSTYTLNGYSALRILPN